MQTQRSEPIDLPNILPADWSWKEPKYDLIATRRVNRMRALRKVPGAWEELEKAYAEDCISFIKDWGWTHDPRNAEVGLPTTFPFALFPKQEEFIAWLYDRWVGREDGLVEKSRDSGATWLAVAFGVWMWKYRPGSIVGFGSRKEEYVDQIGDPKSIFWKIRRFIALLPKELRPKGYDEKKHAPFMRILNPVNDSAIVGEAGDNIGRGNRTSIYFVDESAFVEHGESVESALSETSNCKIHVSTPNEPGDLFHRKRLSRRYPVFTFHWRDDPRKGEEWYAKKVATLDPSIVAREIDINYEASITNAHFPADKIAAAMGKGPADVAGLGKWTISVDVARFGPNETVITCRRGRLVLPQIIMAKSDTQDVAGKVKETVTARGGVDNVDQIAVDDIGLGGGVTDQLRRWYPKKKIKAVIASTRVEDGINYNLRAKMYWECLQWLKDEPNALPNDPELKVQMSSIKYRYKGGLRLICSKKEEETKDMAESASGSPDRADSLALGFAFPPELDDYKPPSIPAPVPFDRTVGY